MSIEHNEDQLDVTATEDEGAEATASSVAGTWTNIATLTGGTVAALAASPNFAQDNRFFAATMAGLFWSDDAGQTWQRAGEGFTGLSLTALAISPSFNEDRTLMAASVDGNLFRIVFDPAGDTIWTLGTWRQRQVSISTLAISPNFRRDGLVFAGTIGDGFFRSRDRGARWEPWNFGLLDLEVLALAVSPNFVEDETLFAATASGVFRSPNAGRAWREVSLPDDAGAVLCLAVSPNYATDQTIFAGTEAGRIFRSTDGGARWRGLPEAFGGEFLNALQISPNYATDHTLMAITEAAVYMTTDEGQRWTRAAETPGAMCAVLPPTFGAPEDGSGPVLTGLAHEGILRSSGDLGDWQPAVSGLTGHLLTGIAVSPQVATDGRMAVFGPSEGIFASLDGGASWNDISNGLPALEVSDLRAAPGTGGLYATLPDGIFASNGWDGDWEAVSDLPTRLLRFSPEFEQDGMMVAASTDRGLVISHDRGATWAQIQGVDPSQEVLALQLSPDFGTDQEMIVALRRQDGNVAVGRGTPAGDWKLVLGYASPARGVLVAGFPAAEETTWYAALDTEVYGPLSPQGCAGHAINDLHPRIVDLVPLPGNGGLIAATELGLFHSLDAITWSPIDGEAARSIVAVAPSPGFAEDRTIYALALGGAIWRFELEG